VGPRNVRPEKTQKRGEEFPNQTHKRGLKDRGRKGLKTTLSFVRKLEDDRYAKVLENDQEEQSKSGSKIDSKGRKKK